MFGGAKVGPAPTTGDDAEDHSENIPSPSASKVTKNADERDAKPSPSSSFDTSAPSPPIQEQQQQQQEHPASLEEANKSVPVPPPHAAWFRHVAAFAGVGLMISTGYIDPGNWATDIAGGASFGYSLLSVILLSSLAAMFLQTLALKLGIAADRDLAQACRERYPRWLSLCLWLAAEVAIMACDLADVMGSATALYLLTGLPLWAGVLVTAADVMLILVLESQSFRLLEALVAAMFAVVIGCLIYVLAVAHPDWAAVGMGFVPSGALFGDSGLLYSALAIVGATVMPHNLFLHSSVVQTRNYDRAREGRSIALVYASWDSAISLFFAMFVNAAILILAASMFYKGTSSASSSPPPSITEAYHLIAPALGQQAAQILFAVALLASGQSSGITGTLSGQVVMEGFLNLSMPPWQRRLLTRLFVVVPAAAVGAALGERGAGALLVLTQVVLSLQLPFAVGPLVHFTCSSSVMGELVNGWVSGALAVFLFFFITGLNVYLLVGLIIAV